MADQCWDPINPITIDRGSSSVLAGISRRFGSFQSCWASMKSMPCLARFRSLYLWIELESHNGIENIPKSVSGQGFGCGDYVKSIVVDYRERFKGI